jgi:cytochrome P450
MASKYAAAGESMKSRRTFVLSGIAATLAGTRALLAAAQNQRRENPSHIPQIPDASGSNGTDDIPLPPRADPKTQLKEDQKALRHDVDHLLQLVQDLKDESDKTPETDVLSLSLVKKAEDTEKLARQIRDRIRAS